MSVESELFIKFTPNYNRLIEYGFKLKNDEYTFEKMFLNNSFRAKICIDKLGKITANVIDIEDNSEYLPLRMEHQEGSFIGEVRQAYTELLKDIRTNGFKENYFISEQGNRISDLIYEKFGNRPVFMWDDYPTDGVFKNPDNNKWYGIIMYIERTKLKEPSKNKVEVLNIKLDEDVIQKLLKQDGFYPAYHMNKKYWITITLDDTIDDETIMELIEKSHTYTVKKIKNRK